MDEPLLVDRHETGPKGSNTETPLRVPTHSPPCHRIIATLREQCVDGVVWTPREARHDLPSSRHAQLPEAPPSDLE